MKQRLKYAFALLHNPIVLILDEPTSNLDEEGIEFVQRIVKQQKEEGVLIVATNDKEEPVGVLRKFTWECRRDNCCQILF